MFRVFGLDHFDLRDAASVALLEAVIHQVITSHYVSLAPTSVAILEAVSQYVSQPISKSQKRPVSKNRPRVRRCCC